MPDETLRTEMLAEIERSRQDSARLLAALARKIRANRGIREATRTVQSAARYVQVHSVNEVVSGLDRVIRRRPASSIAVALVAGFLLGRALRVKRPAR